MSEERMYPEEAVRDAINYIAKDCLAEGQFPTFLPSKEDVKPYIDNGDAVEDEEVVLTALVPIKGYAPILKGEHSEGLDKAYMNLWATLPRDDERDKYWLVIDLCIWSDLMSGDDTVGSPRAQWYFYFTREGGFEVEREE